MESYVAEYPITIRSVYSFFILFIVVQVCLVIIETCHGLTVENKINALKIKMH